MAVDTERGALFRAIVPNQHSRGASSVADWYVEGGHMAERCAGFIIIALGESIVDTGAAFADLTWTHQNVAVFASAFVTAIAM